jgi:hypothetical protein
MRGVKYNLVFHRPDQTTINMSGLTGAELITTIPNLFKTHYGYTINCNKSFIQSLNTRPHFLSKYIREKVSISRIEKPKPSDNQPTTNVVQTNIIEQPNIAQVSV